MSSDAVIEHQPREQVVVHLRSSGLGVVTVRHLSYSVERKLRSYYQRPMRANASAFADELIAGSMLPRRPRREVAALSELDRARLRRALVVVCEVERSWRSLHGSHLSLDERLFAVMLWRHDEWVRESLRDRVRAFRAGSESVPQLKLSVEMTQPTGLAQIVADLARVTVPPAVFMGPPKLGLVAVADLAHACLQAFSPVAALHESVFVGLGKSLAVLSPETSVSLSGSFQTPVREAQESLARVLQQRMHGVVSTGLKATIDSVSSAAHFDRTVSATVSGFNEQTVLANTHLGLVSAMGFNEQSVLANAHGGLVSSRGFDAGLVGFATGGLASRLVDQAAALAFGPGGALALSKVELPKFVLLDCSQLFERFSRPLIHQAVETVELYHEVGGFLVRWERRALWFLLAPVNARAARRLARLTDAEVEEVILATLEVAVSDGAFVPSLREGVTRAPFLTDEQRELLDHMLVLAAEGKYVRACAALYPGLEGAFWEVLCARNFVTPQRTYLDKPAKHANFETQLSNLLLAEDFETFLIRELFGTAGHPYRHGGGTGGQRRLVLFGIAALAGWLEVFGDEAALAGLDQRMAAALPAAVERVQQLALVASTTA